MRSAITTFALTVFLALAGTAVVRADEPGTRQVGLTRKDGWLAASVSMKDLFGERERERMHSGFVVRVIIRAEVMREGDMRPVARAARSTRILYDLWDERYTVEVSEREGRTIVRQVATARDAIELATSLQNFQVVEAGALDPTLTYRIRLRADLNPLSEDLVKDVKKWLVRTPGQGRSATGDSVFGSFVSIFVNPRIEESERMITFWTQPFKGAFP